VKEIKMRVDSVKTRERFNRTGRAITKYARVNGLDIPRLHHIISGNVVPTEKELAALEADGLLVWMEEENKAA
jgi:hypothetical protein